MIKNCKCEDNHCIRTALLLLSVNSDQSCTVLTTKGKNQQDKSGHFVS